MNENIIQESDSAKFKYHSGKHIDDDVSLMREMDEVSKMD